MQRVESNDKKFLINKRKCVIASKQEKKRAAQSNRNSAKHVNNARRQSKIDHETSKLMEENAQKEKKQDEGEETHLRVIEGVKRTICDRQKSSEILKQGCMINADYVNEFLRTLKQEHAEISFVNTCFFKMLLEGNESGVDNAWKACKKHLKPEEEDKQVSGWGHAKNQRPSLEDPILVTPIFVGPESSGHCSCLQGKE